MRYPSIDILRTIAIFVMVLVHFGENLSGFVSPLTGFGAPLFAFLSGVSYRLWVKGQQARGVSELEISKVSVRRGLFVFGVGFAFNILVWLPEDTFNWDVLTFIGTALLLLNVVRKIPLPITVMIAIMVLLISPLLRAQVNYDEYWENGYFECEPTLADVLIGFLVTGYFPTFPWLAFSLAGLVTASLLFDEPAKPSEAKPFSWLIVFVGVALIATTFLALGLRSSLPVAFSTNFLGGWAMFPPTMEYVLGTLGMTLLLLGLTHQFVDRDPRMLHRKEIFNVATIFSRNSFTIYVMHHLVHLWPLWIYGVATGHEPTYFWMRAMPITASIPLALLFLSCCYGILRLLGPDRTYGIESWMRWLCD